MALFSTFLFLLAGCSQQPNAEASVTPKSQPVVVNVNNEFDSRWPSTPQGRKVLIVWNKKYPEAKDLAEYYARARGIPVDNIHMVDVVKKEETHIDELKKNVFETIKAKISSLKEPIDYIVLMKGMPIIVYEDSIEFSLDAYLAAMDKNFPRLSSKPNRSELEKVVNPYFGKNEPFSHKKFGIYLVTRLDGYSFEDARKLVDNSLKAKPHKGPFFFDTLGESFNGGWKLQNDELFQAGNLLKRKGFNTVIESTSKMVTPSEPVAGYAGWGSNDADFTREKYRAIRFLPGAIAETFVSTSARTLMPVTTGQSVVTDLIQQGVTGVKGYVREPYTYALAKPEILFDRYTSGYNLAESFYMSSPFMKWRDIYFGDPLCSPYSK
jgi:uncharacterized protein (TIGR03790 family)